MWKWILIALAGGVLLVVGGAFAWLYFREPAQEPPSAIRVSTSTQRVARGKYHFEFLCDCGGCHSRRDFSRFGGPQVDDGKGEGALVPEEFGLPGRVVASNITPDPETGTGRWSDGEKIRAIRDGVSRDGRALLPMMPYPFYRYMSDEDVESLVAYLNTLKPVRNPLPSTEIDFPANLFTKGVPQPAGKVAPVDRSDPVRYGEYLARLGGCLDCHTPLEGGRLAEDKLLSGGRPFRWGSSLVVSANLTPDDSGIGSWSERQFVEKFAQYRDYVRDGPPKVGPESFTLMPWLGLSQLPDDDLRAIFAFLKTQKPVRNYVDTHPGGVSD
jgi:mono/diheme cytochrome c family protein